MKEQIEKVICMETCSRTKILGKICPRCGQIGGVLFETGLRVVYEYPKLHQYEIIKLRRRPAKVLLIDKQQQLR
jgi:hypothetical protein